MRSVATIFATSMLALFIMLGSSAQEAAATPKNSSIENKTVTVTVEAGDFLSKIADDHDTTYQRLFNANLEISNPNVIHPGQEIKIPAANEQLAERQLPADTPVVTLQSTVAPTPAEATPARAQTKPAAATTTAPSGGVWDQLAQCESGGNWSINTGNGYYGGLQFSQSSWQAAGGTGSPANASKEEQIARAQQLQTIQGWGAWPACSAKLGLS